jgi:hypothetical protein
VKKCARCKKRKPATTEFFYPHAHCKGGLHSRCKVCVQITNRICRNKRIAKNPQAVLEQEKQSTTRWRRAHREQHLTSSRAWKEAHRGAVMIMGAKYRAAKQKLAFDLDKYAAKIEKRISAGCELSGLPFEHEPKCGPFSASIDRKIPSRGYVYSNIRIVCWVLNRAFCNWGEAPALKAFRAWEKKICSAGV